MPGPKKSNWPVAGVSVRRGASRSGALQCGVARGSLMGLRPAGLYVRLRVVASLRRAGAVRPIRRTNVKKQNRGSVAVGEPAQTRKFAYSRQVDSAAKSVPCTQLLPKELGRTAGTPSSASRARSAPAAADGPSATRSSIEKWQLPLP